MRIAVALKKKEFLYDIYALVKAFYPDDEVFLYTQEELPLEQSFDRIIFFNPPAAEDPCAQKDEIKKHLYNMLQKETGKTLPWGTLCGIRPVRIPYQMLESGMSEASICEEMAERFFVSDEKAALSVDIAKREKEILDGHAFAADAFSLYVHVPICPSICAYCSFSSTARDAVENLLPAYLTALEKEMAALSAQRKAQGKTLSPVAVYIGGGTPTVLREDELENLLQSLARYFDMRNLSEYTVEAGRPDSISAKKLELLAGYGVTRLSVNPQTMQQKTLDLIGRSHRVEDVVQAVHAARAAGFDNINMDVIIGLPGETDEDVLNTLRQIERLLPDAMTVHTLALKRASRIVQSQKDRKARGIDPEPGAFAGQALADPQHALALCYEFADEMDMHPYYLYRQKNMRAALENTGFAKEGKECLYNILTMEERMDILALGAGSIAKRVDPDGTITRADTVKEIPLYLERLDEMIDKKLSLYGENS